MGHWIYYPAQGLQPRQSPLALVVAEGNQATMNCHEQESTPQSMLWYRQSAGQGFTLIGYISIGGNARYEEQDQTRYKITGDGDRSSALMLQQAAPADTAVYFCATSAAQRCNLAQCPVKNPTSSKREGREIELLFRQRTSQAQRAPVNTMYKYKYRGFWKI
ncbi:secreted immunoglobulin domain 1 isoform X2 [Scyliorhinus canicula]|uniref:secreted immunoglobulin domain 1 isoform X2 n=1 Tax=Scyliorhinus canicula TaxID=7830 RepID=UPI0018F42C5B|nr:secreted immunoglobulin domain 1 isoform X2 [Scyliorhinus canicula]